MNTQFLDRRKAIPILAIGIAIIGPVAVRLTRPSDENLIIWTSIILPGLAIVFIAGLVFLRSAKAKARRTWELMMDFRSDDTASMFTLYPQTRAALEQLGWSSTVRGFPTDAVLGVSFGTELTIWEAGRTEPTLQIPYTQLAGAELTRMKIDIWAYPAIRLQMPNLGLPGDELVLALCDVDNKSLDEEAQSRILRELEARLLVG